MSDRPIIFSAPMVRALLDGRKTQTRRYAYGPWMAAPDMDSETQEHFDVLGHIFDIADGTVRAHAAPTPWARTKVGDRLWVREAWALEAISDDGERLIWRADHQAVWRSEPGKAFFMRSNYRPDRWRPSIHMPRRCSRLTLDVTAVKVERLQEISEEDARAEGVLYVPGHGDITPADLSEGYSNYLNCRMGFEVLWNSLHGAGAWDANPWVVAVTFTVIKGNIDNVKP